LEQRLERLESALQEERAQLAEDLKEVNRQLQELAAKRKRDDGDDEEGDIRRSDPAADLKEFARELVKAQREDKDDLDAEQKDSSKVELTKFSDKGGELTAAAWIPTLERNFKLKRTRDEARILLALNLLTGPAQTWADGVGGITDDTDFDIFKVKFIKKFTDTLQGDALKAKAKNLKQGKRPMQKFTTEFMNWFCEVENCSDVKGYWTTEQKLDLFIDGCGEKVQEYFALQKPKDIDEAMDIATRLDKKTFEHAKKVAESGSGGNPKTSFQPRFAPRGSRPSPSPGLRPQAAAITSSPSLRPSGNFSRGASPFAPMLNAMQQMQHAMERMEFGSANNNDLNAVGKDDDITRGPLTPAKRARCIRENRCFFCREVGHAIQGCEARQQLNALEEGEMEESEENSQKESGN